jgi:hypothetical protein
MYSYLSLSAEKRGSGNLSYRAIDCQFSIPERGWAALTVGGHVGAMIKALARSRGPTASDYLERLIAIGGELEISVDGMRSMRRKAQG